MKLFGEIRIVGVMLKFMTSLSRLSMFKMLMMLMLLMMIMMMMLLMHSDVVDVLGCC